MSKFYRKPGQGAALLSSPSPAFHLPSWHHCQNLSVSRVWWRAFDVFLWENPVVCRPTGLCLVCCFTSNHRARSRRPTGWEVGWLLSIRLGLWSRNEQSSPRLKKPFVYTTDVTPEVRSSERIIGKHRRTSDDAFHLFLFPPTPYHLQIFLSGLLSFLSLYHSLFISSV